MVSGGIRSDIPRALKSDSEVPPPAPEKPAKATGQSSWIDSLWQKCVQFWESWRNKPSQGQDQP